MILLVSAHQAIRKYIQCVIFIPVKCTASSRSAFSISSNVSSRRVCCETSDYPAKGAKRQSHQCFMFPQFLLWQTSSAHRTSSVERPTQLHIVHHASPSPHKVRLLVSLHIPRTSHNPRHHRPFHLAHLPTLPPHRPNALSFHLLPITPLPPPSKPPTYAPSTETTAPPAAR